jgi:hypothetical protein
MRRRRGRGRCRAARDTGSTPGRWIGNAAADQQPAAEPPPGRPGVRQGGDAEKTRRLIAETVDTVLDLGIAWRSTNHGTPGDPG